MVTRSKDDIVNPKHLADYVTHYTIFYPIQSAFATIMSLLKKRPRPSNHPVSMKNGLILCRKNMMLLC